MIAAYVVNGVKSGLVAGIVFGLLVALVANPLVAFAEERAQIEHDGDATGTNDHDHEHAGTDHGHASGDGLPAVVSNGVSALSGVLWGVFLGVTAFGIAFYALEPIVPGSGTVRSYVFGGAGFLTASVAPWLVFPPAPPGVGRTLDPNAAALLYFGAVAAGAVASVAGMYAYDRLRDARGRSAAVVGGVLPWVLLVAAAIGVTGMPTVAAPAGMSAALADGMVGLVVFGQALTWLVMAVAHARFHARSDRNARPADPRLAEDAPAGNP